MTWEDKFTSWAAAPSATEQQKMENAQTAIKKAIAADDRLAAMDISVITQGSYRSRTNVRQDSDVDICVRLNSTFFPHYPSGRDKEHYGNVDGSISHSEFRTYVHTALTNYFTRDQITPGRKALHIHSNSYRIDADVVPTLAFRHYFDDGINDYVQPTGTGFFSSGTDSRIINWPEQTYENGLQKHNRTGRRFRKMVRIIKRLRNEMQDEGIESAKDIASFLIESMVWNAPDNYFGHDNYTADVRGVLAHCFNETLPAGKHASLNEVNDRKLLFGTHQNWTREKAHAFFSSAWDYLAFQ